MLPIPNRVAFTLFGIDVMWYGFLIASGMLLAIILGLRRAPSYNLDPDKVFDMILITLPVGIVGARLYYILFNWERYAGNFLKIINFRAGGLAIHGGLIAGFAVAYYLCRRYKYNPFNVLDMAAPLVAMAQAIGRWGNYFNQEAHGGPTDLPWAIEVRGEMVHPTFLYESIWCLFLFFLLSHLAKKRKFEGQIFLLYGMLYSLERFFVEGLRTDSLMIGPLRTAQLVSLVTIAAFGILYAILAKRSKNSVLGGSGTPNPDGNEPDNLENSTDETLK